MIGKNILKYRKLRNISQTQLAKKLNVTRQAVSNWERNKTEPDMQTIIRLVGIFGVDVSELLNCSEKHFIAPNTLKKLLFFTALYISLIIIGTQRTELLNNSPVYKYIFNAFIGIGGFTICYLLTVLAINIKRKN